MPTDRPLLNLRVDARPVARTGGGKSTRSIRFDRLADQTQVLSDAADEMVGRLQDQPRFGQSIHLVATMFGDSLATTHTPNDLFEGASGFELVAPLRDGYLVEADATALHDLSSRIQVQRTAKIRADVSRVKEIALFEGSQALRGIQEQQLWDLAVPGNAGRLFFVWLTPLKTPAARGALVAKIEALRRDGVIQAPPPLRLASAIGGTGASVALAEPDRFAVAEATFRRDGAALLPLQVPSPKSLAQLVSSGTVVRVDPVRRLAVTAPGEGPEPAPPLDLADEPIVAVVDGGCTATSYAHAEAWRAAPTFVGDADADTKHGNAIVSLVVNGHAWNGRRPLPELNCRVGIVQAVPKREAVVSWDEYALLGYLEAVARTQPETKVWNISANMPAVGTNEVSALGHGLTRLARSARILPVISIGNNENGDSRLRPPADCEASIVVGGCTANGDGTPAGWCNSCARGPGPQLMRKPDVANFSELRFIGGVTGCASSYATAATSPIVAHTLARLRENDPDLAKAVVLHATEGRMHDAGVGWGTPFGNGRLPWECAPGTATFVFRAELKPGFAYYWNIPIPPALVRSRKLVGGFKLTAILEPMLSEAGMGNYFASRLETNLQFKNRQDKAQALLGRLDENELEEQEARIDVSKWEPVRHFPLVMIPRGRSFIGNELRLYARVYVRDKFQFDLTANEDAPAQRVAFALSLIAPDGDENFYDATVAQFGNLVENALDAEVEAVLEQ